MNLMAASRMDSCGLCKYGRVWRRYSSALLLRSASWRERKGMEGRVGADSPPAPRTGLPCQDTHDAQPAAGWCRGLEGAEGWVLPGELRCHPAAKAQLGQGSVGTPRLGEGEEPGEEPTGPRARRKGACVGCGVQAGGDGLQQWAGAQLPALHTGHWGQGACPGWACGFEAILTRRSLTAHGCSLSSSCLSFLFFRNSVA